MSPPQPSHQVETSARDIAALIAPSLLLALVGIAIAWAFARFQPAHPGPGIDFDQTLLAFKGAAARHAAKEANPPSILLAGDSSCLMNVSIAELDRALDTPTPSLNLGTLSYLTLDDHRALLVTALANRTHPPASVVLLLHPQSLHTSSPSESHRQMLEHALAANTTRMELPPLATLSQDLQPARFIALLQQHWLPRLAPVPLPGRYGATYGFTADLWRYLETHRGSAVEPGRLDPATLQGDPTPRLAPGFVNQTRAFRTGWPTGTRLVIGLSPLPRSLALPDQPQRHAAALEQCRQLLGADAALAELPAVLDDSLFATRTHLTAQAQIQYTRDLARHLADLPP